VEHHFLNHHLQVIEPALSPEVKQNEEEQQE
jgi:hypothetical protein